MNKGPMPDVYEVAPARGREKEPSRGLWKAMDRRQALGKGKQ